MCLKLDSTYSDLESHLLRRGESKMLTECPNIVGGELSEGAAMTRRMRLLYIYICIYFNINIMNSILRSNWRAEK